MGQMSMNIFHTRHGRACFHVLGSGCRLSGAGTLQRAPPAPLMEAQTPSRLSVPCVRRGPRVWTPVLSDAPAGAFFWQLSGSLLCTPGLPFHTAEVRDSHSVCGVEKKRSWSVHGGEAVYLLSPWCCQVCGVRELRQGVPYLTLLQTGPDIAFHPRHKCVRSVRVRVCPSCRVLFVCACERRGSTSLHVSVLPSWRKPTRRWLEDGRSPQTEDWNHTAGLTLHEIIVLSMFSFDTSINLFVLERKDTKL